MPGFQFTDNQPVVSLPTEDPVKVVDYIEKCTIESEKNRNRFAIMTGSWLQDADKCEQLFYGILYTERQKMKYECKPDEYAYYVRFNAQLLTQFDFKEHVKTVDDGETVNPKEQLDAISMSRVLQYCQKRNNTNEKEEDELLFVGIHGNGIEKFQPSVDEDGRPWPGHETFNPRYFGISPGATSVEDCVWCFYRRPVSVHELKEAYPDQAENIKADPSISIDAQSPTTDGTGFNVTFSAIGNGAKVLGDFVQDIFSGETRGQQAYLTEFYFRDPAVIEIGSEDELKEWINSNAGFGGEQFRNKSFQEYSMKLANALENGEKLTVKKYPFGRRIMTACKLKLEDIPNPYPWFPFIMTKCYRRPKEAWAKGIIHTIREPIQNKQMIMAGCAANTDYRQRSAYFATGSPQLQQIKKIPTGPNELMYLGPQGSKIEAIPVPPIVTQDSITLAENRRRDAEMTSGLESVLGGVNQTGTYSGVQFEKQADLAMGKVAPRYRELTRTRQKRGEWYLWFIQNYMTDERRLEFLTEAEGQRYMVLNQMASDAGAPVIQNDVTKGKFHYFIEIGINRPMSKQERSRQTQEAAEIMAPFAPLLAAQMKLEAMDMPGKYELLDKFKKALESKQEQEMRMQQTQMKMAQDKQALEANKIERELDVKEVQAGAQVQESMAWVLQGLSKAGIQVPPEVIAELGFVAKDVTAQTAETEVGV